MFWVVKEIKTKAMQQVIKKSKKKKNMIAIEPVNGRQKTGFYLITVISEREGQFI